MLNIVEQTARRPLCTEYILRRIADFSRIAVMLVFAVLYLRRNRKIIGYSSRSNMAVGTNTSDSE